MDPIATAIVAALANLSKDAIISDPVEYPYLMVREVGEAEGAGERGEKYFGWVA